jgi:predicted nucleic acid-binding protein
MWLVVDTSAVLAVLLNEPSKNELIARSTGAVLAAPASLHWEIGNALSAMLKRRRLTLSEARQALQGYQEIPLRLIDVGLEEALSITAASGIYAYDAYFIVCAQRLPATLVTLDSGLAAAARAAGVEVVHVPEE